MNCGAVQLLFDNLNFKNNYFNYKFPVPQYLGSKYRHLEWIGSCIPGNVNRVMDVFAGSQAVAFYFKQKGYEVFTNDFMSYSYRIGKGLVENGKTRLDGNDIKILFSRNRSEKDFHLMRDLFTDIFFIEKECEFLDGFRSNIDLLENDYKKSLAFSVINRAMMRKVTMGHFAHTKALEYAANKDRVKRNRSLIVPLKDLFMELLDEYNNAVFDNKKDNKSFNMDAVEFINEHSEGMDMAYFDPPYCNSHADYQAFYHLLETYTEYWKDKKFINGTNCYYPKKKSGFVLKSEILNSFDRLFEASQRIPYWMISYNDRSYPDLNTMINIISKYKNVKVFKKNYENKVGGKGSVAGSNELLFVCSPRQS